MGQKHMFIWTETEKGEKKTKFTITFIKSIENPNWLEDEHEEMYLRETMEEDHHFNSKMVYRIRRFFKYEFQKTDLITLNFNDIKLEEFKTIIEGAIPDTQLAAIDFEGHNAFIMNDSLGRTHELLVVSFKEVMAELEEKWMHLKY